MQYLLADHHAVETVETADEIAARRQRALRFVLEEQKAEEKVVEKTETEADIRPRSASVMFVEQMLSKELGDGPIHAH